MEWFIQNAFKIVNFTKIPEKTLRCIRSAEKFHVTVQAEQANKQASDSIEQQMELMFNEDDEPVSSIDHPGGTDENAEINQNSGAIKRWCK